MDAPLSADADAQSPFPASSKNSALKKGEGGTAEIEQNITKTLMLLIQTPPPNKSYYKIVVLNVRRRCSCKER